MSTQRFLQSIALTVVFTGVLLIVLFECELLPRGVLSSSPNTELMAGTVLILLTLCLIPIAMRWDRIPFVHRRMQQATAAQHRNLYLIRILLVGVPMLCNVAFYYLFDTVGFVYLAIVLLLSFILVYPTHGRISTPTSSEQEGSEQ